MTDTSGPVRVLFVTNWPDRWRAARTALESTDGLSVTTAAPTEWRAVDPGVDCVVATQDEATDVVPVLDAVGAARPRAGRVLLAADGAVRPTSRAVAAGVDGVVPGSTPEAPELLVERVTEAAAAPRPVGDGGAVQTPIDDLDVHEELRLKQRAMDEAPVGITISDADRPDNPLIYVNDAFVRLTGYEKSEVVGRNCRFMQGPESDPEAVSAMREAIDAGEPVSVELVNYRADGEPFWNRVHIAPVHDETGEVTHFAGFQMDVTERKRAETEATRRREELEHVLVRIDGLLQDVTRELVQAGSRRELEEAVCERVAGTDAYAFGWVGGPDYATDRLIATVTAGEWTPEADDLAIDLSASAGGPTTRAYETGEVQVLLDSALLAEQAAATGWLDADALGGIAAVPLTYGDTTYGVLTLYTTDADALTDHERVVLGALGRAAGTAINALERGRMLASDSVTELVLRTTDTDLFFVELSAETGCFLEYRGAVQREDGSMLTFFTTDADDDAVRRVAAEYSDIESAAPIHEYEDATLWEFALADGSIIARLTERGATLRSIEVADGTGEVTVELPTESEATAVVDVVRERYPETTIVAHREREGPPRSRQGFVAELEDRLTQRQLTALRKAHVSGYYDWDRSVNGEDLADSMGIDRSTFHQHLRAAERKLTEAFFEGSAAGG